MEASPKEERMRDEVSVDMDMDVDVDELSSLSTRCNERTKMPLVFYSVVSEVDFAPRSFFCLELRV